MIAEGRSGKKGDRVNRVKSERDRASVVSLRAHMQAEGHGDSPGREGSEGRPEASHPSLPSFPECLLHQLALGGGIHAPKTPFPGLVLRAGHFQKVTVERQVVSD